MQCQPGIRADFTLLNKKYMSFLLIYWLFLVSKPPQITKKAYLLERVCTFQGRRIPLKKSGIHMGSTTASLSSFLASSRSAMSSLQFIQRKQSSVKNTIFPDSKMYERVWKNLCFPHTSVRLGYGTQCLSPVSPPGRCHILCHQTSYALHLLVLLQPLSSPDEEKGGKMV